MSGLARKEPLAPGLYLVATPIGSARDITLRALDVLASADVLAAEDTRTLRKLMEIHGIPVEGRPMLSYHDHNGAKQRPKLLAMISEGKSVAYASDAGTPLVADPGFVLAREAIREDHLVTGAPGPVAAIAALTLSGLPTDRFAFAGFLPTSGAARRRAIEEVADFPGTLIFYESPKRCSSMLKECESILGGERDAAVCRELTKRFEEVRRGTLSELAAVYDGQTPKGEIVVCIGRSLGGGPVDVEAALEEALKSATVKDAAREVSQRLGLPRRDVYQAALAMADRQGDDE